MATSRLEPRRATSSGVIRVPLVEMQVMMPWPWQAARICSKSGRMNGSPPPKLTWKTPAVCSCSTRSSASAVESSLQAFSPEAERQWLQRRLQASVTSQVRFTGERIPISTYLLLMEKSFFQELRYECLQGLLLGIRGAGGKFIPGAYGPEEVGRQQTAGSCEEKARSPAIVKQETEPL